ncbi:MAG: methylenetetrahydrofolate reductase [Gammaproteobacteria bacterium]|uniref:Methylenetetrahydrofolate reductase n=1 Tax=SAR86 cluster bacterium TaxID=2030880 RepID=A0A368C506_9GAMM|nr:MAG: methylenetetrahydrofolate reductase [SAR86 cluster bacterium]RPG40386.1 MAG: methylenetetrahydrofolate reductase [Gammaproteobacteria bacterium TMED186]|tara:strand:- start:1386 stop:2243 length:858 start_codon:yes stop_codon:yes gene_type:complete
MTDALVKNFIEGFSIEVVPNSAAKVESFAEILPNGTRVYIAHLSEKEDIKTMVATAKRINEEGFSVMPHIPARIIKNKAMLAEWISMYKNEANVDQALLLAGGSSDVLGEFDSSMQLIETGLFDQAGFKRLHVAGHPEGSKDIDPDGGSKNVSSALSWKQEFSKRTDAQMAIATQFCFDADAVSQWATNIKNNGIDIPIHIGIAGPAKLQTLLRFSIECGIGPSMKVLTKRAKDITKLLLPYKPTEILKGLAEHKKQDPELNIEQVHFFPIGGIKQTADFIKEVS